MDMTNASFSGWPFNESPDLAVFTTRQVLEGEPILFVSRDSDDGTWQFHTGALVAGVDGRLIALKNILAHDETLAQLKDLPVGWVATRQSVSDVWCRRVAAS